MSPWVYILLMVAAIAAFLIVLRQVRGLKTLVAKHLALSEPAGEEAAGSTGNAIQVHPEGADPVALKQGLDRIGERLDAMQQDIQMLHAEIEARAGGGAVSEVTPGADSSVDLETVARRYLSREGFERVQITSKRPDSGGIRFIVRAQRGDELRAGHVLVRGDEIVDAHLSVPSALFP